MSSELNVIAHIVGATAVVMAASMAAMIILGCIAALRVAWQLTAMPSLEALLGVKRIPTPARRASSAAFVESRASPP